MGTVGGVSGEARCGIHAEYATRCNQVQPLMQPKRSLGYVLWVPRKQFGLAPFFLLMGGGGGGGGGFVSVPSGTVPKRANAGGSIRWV